MSQLSDYIKQARTAGLSDTAITDELKKTGWDDLNITNGFAELSTGPEIVSAPLDIYQELASTGQSKTFWQKFKLPAIIGGAVVILGAGSYFAYAYYFNNPQRILQQAISNMSKVASGHVKFEATISEKIPESENSENGNFLDLFGVKNFSISMKGDGDYVAKADAYDYDGTITVSTKIFGTNISVDIEAKKIGEDYFIKIADSPLSQILGEEGFTSEWIKFNQESLKKMVEEEGSDISSFDINDEQIKMLQEAAKGYNYVKVDKNLGTEEVSGKKTLHYQMAFDKQGLKGYLNKVLDLVTAEIEELNQEDKELFYSIMAGYIDNTDITSEMWIGKSDKLIYRSVLNLQMPSFFGLTNAMGGIGDEIEGDNFANKQKRVELLNNSFSKAEKTMKFNITVDSTDFNKKVEIKEPTEAVDFVELFGSARSKSRDAKRIADIKQIMTALEMSYADLNGYPISGTPVILGKGNFSAIGNTGFAASTVAFTTIYMSQVPVNPVPGGSNYVYCSATTEQPNQCASSGESYIITFQLENTTGGLSTGQHRATSMGIE
ncbi:MAG: hypothetical protein WC575_01880 [Patescibacteria group bacterium]